MRRMWGGAGDGRDKTLYVPHGREPSQKRPLGVHRCSDGTFSEGFFGQLVLPRRLRVRMEEHYAGSDAVSA